MWGTAIRNTWSWTETGGPQVKNALPRGGVITGIKAMQASPKEEEPKKGHFPPKATPLWPAWHEIHIGVIGLC